MKQGEQLGPANVTVMIIGTKCDLETKRQVSKQEAKELAKQNNILWIEVSSKTGTNVKQAFDTIAKSIKTKFSQCLHRVM